MRARDYLPARPPRRVVVRRVLQVGLAEGLPTLLLEARHWPRPYDGYPGSMPTREEVMEVLREVEDPELGMDIVELGLLYDVEVEDSKVKVIHSLTSMGCPAGPMIQESIYEAVQRVPGVGDVEVELTWDPPWTPERMSEDAKFILGFG